MILIRLVNKLPVIVVVAVERMVDVDRMVTVAVVTERLVDVAVKVRLVVDGHTDDVGGCKLALNNPSVPSVFPMTAGSLQITIEMASEHGSSPLDTISHIIASPCLYKNRHLPDTT